MIGTNPRRSTMSATGQCTFGESALPRKPDFGRRSACHRLRLSVHSKMEPPGTPTDPCNPTRDDDAEDIEADSVRLSMNNALPGSAARGAVAPLIAKIPTHSKLASLIALRAVPIQTFLDGSGVELAIASVNEEKLLKIYGLTDDDRNEVEGLTSTTASSVGRAVTELAYDPPRIVGAIQGRARSTLLRPFPHGLRFSGANMNPLPPWLGGAHCVALNMSNNDLPLQLHYALFDGTAGYLLKPKEMRRGMGAWPPPHDSLCSLSLSILSVHNLPRRGEQRPRFGGSRVACHAYLPQLSGAASPPPSGGSVSSPAVTVSLHAIGGFTAVSTEHPLPADEPAGRFSTMYSTPPVHSNGLNAYFGAKVHCVAAEPKATFMRISVQDAGQEVAYDTVVMGRLRTGYRVVRLRSLPLGTRIDLCYVFVHISLTSQINHWATPSELRYRNLRLKEEVEETRRKLSTRESAASLFSRGKSTMLLGCNESSDDRTREQSLCDGAHLLETVCSEASDRKQSFETISSEGLAVSGRGTTRVSWGTSADGSRRRSA